MATPKAIPELAVDDLAIVVSERSLTCSELSAIVVRLAREQVALRRLAERNESTLQKVLKAFEQLAESQRLASDQANAALTIVQNALVLRVPSPETEHGASEPAASNAANRALPEASPV